MTGTPLLHIDGLSKSYRGDDKHFALQDVSLTVYPGEFITVLGSSGAGKSTLIRCLNRLVEPSQGHIHFRQDDILQFSPKQLRAFRTQVGMIFQNFNLIENMSVLRNVVVGSFGSLPTHKILRNRYPADVLSRAHNALETVGMEEFKTRKVRDLSGGQRQRVAVARALVQQPSLILGDEPVASLDPVTSKIIMDLLNQIRMKHDITMIINLHSIELAQEYATRVIGLSHGRIVFNGPPRQLNDSILESIYIGAK